MKLTQKSIFKLKEEILAEFYKDRNPEALGKIAGLGVDLITMVCAITADNEKKAFEGVDIAMNDCKKRLHIMYAVLDAAKEGQPNVKN